jgi:hypothetical protein
LGHPGDRLFGGRIQVERINAAARPDALAINERIIMIEVSLAIHSSLLRCCAAAATVAAACNKRRRRYLGSSVESRLEIV